MNKKINLYMETSDGIIYIPFIGLEEADLFTIHYNSRLDKKDLNNKSELLDVLIKILELPISINDIGRVYLSEKDIESLEFNYEECLPIKYSKDNYNIDSLIENFSLFLKRNHGRLNYPGIKKTAMNVIGNFKIDTISDRSIDIIARKFLNNNYKRIRNIYFYLNELDSPTERYNIKIDKVLDKEKHNYRKKLSQMSSTEDNFIQYLLELSSRNKENSSIAMEELSKMELEDIKKEIGTDSSYLFDGLNNHKKNNIDEDIANLEKYTGIDIDVLRKVCNSQISNGRKK